MVEKSSSSYGQISPFMLFLLYTRVCLRLMTAECDFLPLILSRSIMCERMYDALPAVKFSYLFFVCFIVLWLSFENKNYNYV